MYEYRSSCYIRDSRAVADMGAAAVDSIPSSTVTQGKFLWKLESYYPDISIYRIRYKVHFYAQSGKMQSSRIQPQASCGLVHEYCYK